jgi:acyl-CoA thioesterase I
MSVRSCMAAVKALLVPACLAALFLGGCRVPESAVVLPATPPRPQRLTVMFLGDSLTAGFGVDQAEAFPALIDNYWKTHGLPYVARNGGVSGDRTAEVLRRIDSFMSPSVELAVLAIGANDAFGRVPVETIKSNMSGIIARIRKAGARVVLSSMSFAPQYLGGDTDYTSRFNALYEDVGRKERVRVLPPLLRSLWSRDDLWLPDNLHPTPEGHTLIARDLLRDLNPDWK